MKTEEKREVLDRAKVWAEIKEADHEHGTKLAGLLSRLAATFGRVKLEGIGPEWKPAGVLVLPVRPMETTTKGKGDERKKSGRRRNGR